VVAHKKFLARQKSVVLLWKRSPERAAITLHEELAITPTWRANCQMVRSVQPTGVLIPMVYLFGREESKAKNSKVAHESRNTENTASLYWFGPPKSNTLCPVVGVDCLRIGFIVQGVASSALYWPADEVGSQTPGRLRPAYLSLRYTSCHIPSICFRRSPPRSLSCTPSLEVVVD
jgi:hypothetical protein